MKLVAQALFAVVSLLSACLLGRIQAVGAHRPQLDLGTVRAVMSLDYGLAQFGGNRTNQALDLAQLDVFSDVLAISAVVHELLLVLLVIVSC